MEGPVAYHTFVKTLMYGKIGGYKGVSLKGKCYMCTGMKNPSHGVSLFGKVSLLTSCLHSFWKPMPVLYMVSNGRVFAVAQMGLQSQWVFQQQVVIGTHSNVHHHSSNRRLPKQVRQDRLKKHEKNSWTHPWFLIDFPWNTVDKTQETSSLELFVQLQQNSNSIQCPQSNPINLHLFFWTKTPPKVVSGISAQTISR